MTCSEMLLQELQFSPKSLAVHEFSTTKEHYSENNIATRLSELAHEGKVKGQVREGFAYKEWSLVRVEKSGQILFEGMAA